MASFQPKWTDVAAARPTTPGTAIIRAIASARRRKAFLTARMTLPRNVSFEAVPFHRSGAHCLFPAEHVVGHLRGGAPGLGRGALLPDPVHNPDRDPIPTRRRDKLVCDAVATRVRLEARTLAASMYECNTTLQHVGRGDHCAGLEFHPTEGRRRQ